MGCDTEEPRDVRPRGERDFTTRPDHDATLKYPRYQATNLARPSASGVDGENPVSADKRSIAAYVTGTSPGCIGAYSLIALRPSSPARVAMNVSSSTASWLPML